MLLDTYLNSELVIIKYEINEQNKEKYVNIDKKKKEKKKEKYVNQASFLN